jgi:hypothetical protein
MASNCYSLGNQSIVNVNGHLFSISENSRCRPLRSTLIKLFGGTNSKEFEIILKIKIEMWRKYQILVTFFLVLNFICLLLHSYLCSLLPFNLILFLFFIRICSCQFSFLPI